MKKVPEFTAGDRIDRYLRGELSPDEEARFEEAMLSDPDMQRELESAMRLRAGLKDLAARGQLSYHSAPATRWLARAAAVAAVVMIPVMVLMLGNRGSDVGGGGAPDSNQPAASSSSLVQSDVQLLDLYPMRSLSTPESAVQVRQSSLLVLSLTVSDISFNQYEVRIEDHAGSLIWTEGGLPRDEVDAIVVGVSGDQLVPGEYTVRVIGVSESGSQHPAGLYRFRYALGEGSPAS